MLYGIIQLNYFIIRRSNHVEWNYSAELFAFSARLGEQIPSKLLEDVFTTEGYIEAEKEKYAQLNIQDISLQMKSNKNLANKGEDILESVVSSWLRGAFPALPEEGIQAVKEYLLSEETLAEVSFHIGAKDLIQSIEYPPLRETFAQTFKAVVGALNTCSGEARAEKFIREILIAQLEGKDINSIWEISNPMRVLSILLQNMKMEAPEPRLLWQSGPKTLLSSFIVGIYSDKKLIGQFAGESVEVAEEMAARDALRRLFKTTDCMKPLPVHSPSISSTKPNKSIQDWRIEDQPNIVNLSS
ncbi:39S ribosomal protein L44, mitochondrial [Eurytemora carolleeae]|uniref:39S ribosomal protein L44, mitochondrial n=1 Tax=Eurytemora carolleeae TaxID=1294199 RepID=UPI000C7946FF|nr:39S ribosomal protein L44, mitochondrial [Eurytemora carolleeae]|eukprot:XP_023349039.1 39S ribosomal protein L44, mitochondrial-like [Eurytemora affinis]